MPVISVRIGVEDDGPIGKGRDCLDTLLHVAAPQLEVAAIVCRPVLVEVEEQVHPPTPVPVLRVNREVGVDVEEAPRHRLVEPTSVQGFVDVEVRDSGELSQRADEIGRIQPLGYRSERETPCLDVPIGELAFVDMEVIDPTLWIDGPELVNRSASNLG
jgi:hypothetical protein